MFDISFTELAFCFVVALIVLGPERLPKVARTVGRWSGQARAYVRNFTAELERETQIGDIRQQLEDARRSVANTESAARKAANEVSKDIESGP